MRRRTWTGWGVALVVAALSVATARADGRAVRVFTDADATATVATLPADPAWAFAVQPLYGGSDRSAFTVVAKAPPNTQTPSDPPVLTVLDVALPTDVQPGDELRGRLLVSPVEGNASPDPGSAPPARVEVAVAGTDRRWKTVAQPPATLRPNGLQSMEAAVSLRVPIETDPAHRPDRLRLTVSIASGTIDYTERDITAYGLRLVRPGGSAQEPSTRPTGHPSPPGPPSGTVKSVVRQFNGADFDSHVLSTVSGDSKDPVEMLGSTDKGGFVEVEVQEPPVAEPTRTIPILAVDDPGVTAGRFAVTGTVAYAGADTNDVDGFGYVELVSDFAAGEPTVTRTLADSGPMRVFRGRSGARPFVLPVDAGDRRPTRVRVNLVVSGTGLITLSDLKLVQYDPAAPATETAAVAPPSWARPSVTATAARLFGLVGLLGFAGPLVHRGRGRPLVLAGLVGIGLLGEAYFGWAMAVLGRGDGPATWVPLLACGVAGLCVPALTPWVNRRYRDAELRRMRAVDAVAV